MRSNISAQITKYARLTAHSRYCAGGTHDTYTPRSSRSAASSSAIKACPAVDRNCSSMRCETNVLLHRRRLARQLSPAHVHVPGHFLNCARVPYHRFAPRQECVHIWFPTKRTSRGTRHPPEHKCSNRFKADRKRDSWWQLE